MARRGRPFWFYLGATLVALILLNATGVGNWGVAHGQTAPGRHSGARAAEATPGGSGGQSGVVSVSSAGASNASAVVSIRATTVLGLFLAGTGLALIMVGAWRAVRRRRSAFAKNAEPR